MSLQRCDFYAIDCISASGQLVCRPLLIGTSLGASALQQAAAFSTDIPINFKKHCGAGSPSVSSSAACRQRKEKMKDQMQPFRGFAGGIRHVAIAGAALVLASAVRPALAASYTFIPGADNAGNAGFNAAGSADWDDPNSWVNGASYGTLPGAADQAGSATGGTTIVDTVVPTINELRFANSPAGSTVAEPNGDLISATADATLDIETGGSLTIDSTNGTSNGDAWFGRAQPSGGTLNISGGTLTTGSTVPIANDSAANVSIGNISGSNGGNPPAIGAANSFFNISAGTLNAGNNFIVGDTSASVSGTSYYAAGTGTQTGGIVNVTGSVEIGQWGDGSYTISGGTLNQLGTNPDGSSLGRDAFFVGRNGPSGSDNAAAGATGSFTQTGGAVSIANGLYIANNSKTTGSYTISGGTLTIDGEIKVGASTNSTGNTAVTNNVGSFSIIGNDAQNIIANKLTANTANSTLGFTIDSAAGTTLLDLVPGTVDNAAGNLSYDGSANLSTATLLDLDAGNGFVPTAGETFTLLTATSINAIPTLVPDSAFDDATLSIVTNPDSTQSLLATVATVPEPAVLATLSMGGLLLRRRRR